MIGEKIRSIRKSKNITIVELSEKIEVTSGYISQIERDLISPSLSVLTRISKALEIPLSILFSDDSSEKIVTILSNERTCVKLKNINTEFEYITPFATKKDNPNDLEAFLCNIPSKTHFSNKFVMVDSKCNIYIVKGSIQFNILNKTYDLNEGDCICIPEKTNYLMYNSSDDTCQVLYMVQNSFSMSIT